MGYYYEQPPQEEKPPGCLDVLLITRAVFGVLLIPLAMIAGVVVDVSAIFYLFALSPPLALIPVGLTAGAIWLFARWEQSRDLPPDA